MSLLVPAIQVAGAVHLILAAGNLVLPRKLEYRANLAKVPPIIRQIFVVHSVYIVLVLLLFGSLCLFFAPDLAGGSSLGRFLSGCLAAFWLFRLPLQWFYYDGSLRREHRAGDVSYMAAVAFLGAVFAIAAWAG